MNTLERIRLTIKFAIAVFNAMKQNDKHCYSFFAYQRVAENSNHQTCVGIILREVSRDGFATYKLGFGTVEDQEIYNMETRFKK